MKNTEKIQFDGITVWNFSLLKSQCIKDEGLRDYISQLLATNRLHNEPIENIGIVAVGNSFNFRHHSPTEARRVSDLRKVLFLCSVAGSNIRHGHNAGHSMVTTENFTLVYQNFAIDSPYTADSSGSIVSTLAGGHKISEIRYGVPMHVLPHNSTIDQELLNSMKKVKRKRNTVYRTILHATEAFMNGYLNSDDVSYESRILEQVRAFEILFSLPEREQRKELKSRIDYYCRPRKSRAFRYKSERANGKKVWEMGSRQKMWADRFYVLRNHIIHGDTIRNAEYLFYDQRHHDLGLWFFLVSVKKTVNEALGQKIFFDTVPYRDGVFKYDSGHMERAFEQAVTLLSKNGP